MPKKIFEIANELGKGALDLVEELKGHGFNVRNHMSALSDEDLDKAMGLIAPKTDDSGSKKKAKKKVTKKKAAKKKVTKKKVVKKVAKATTAVTEEVVAKDDADTESEKKTVTRRKSVVRKKADEPKVEPQKEASDEASDSSTPKEQDDIVKDAPRGLQVVAQAPKKEEAPVAEEKIDSDEQKVEEKPSDDGKSPEELLNTKNFGLRVVAKAEPKPKEEAKPTPGKPDINDKVADVDDDPTKKKDTKKRIGGLASMISAKKANISKSQTLNEQRAENELKSYAAISGSGRPIYTQVKKKRTYTGPSKRTEITEVKDTKRVVKLHGGAYVEELAKKLKIKLKELIDKALDLNLLIKNGDYVGLSLASKLADLYDYRIEDVSFNEDEIIGKKDLDEEEIEKLPSRNPIITIMGHVDHGKTTLLDYIRSAKVADGEAGGITQHIGAYSVNVKNSTLTFLDTPGHAAFGAMRQRGADITDIVVLIVAADDGVMPQTKESIKFIQNAGKPVIVAVNKMDKEGANPDRVKQELTEHGITPEDWGGETQFCNISALQGEGVDGLLESIALQSEMLELRAEAKGHAEGVVIESRVEPGRGSLATVLIQSGTLKKGDSIVVGETYGRARNLSDTLGRDIKSAGPSTPVQILGLGDAPNPGDSLNAVKNEREAKKIAQNRFDERKTLETTITTQKKVSLEDFFAAAPVEEGKKKDLNLIVRSDVQGSYEAIKTALENLSNEEVTVKMIAGGVGPISDNDVLLADSASAFLVGFNMRPSTTARRLAEEKGLDVKTYSIIYELINDVKLAIEGLLDPDVVEEFIGRAEVRDTFSVPKIGLIAGSYVIDGSIEVGCSVRLLRDGKILFDGKMSSLKRFKDDVKEVKSGYECGVGLENYNDVKVGDLFEAYKMIEKKRTLEDVAGVQNEL